VLGPNQATQQDILANLAGRYRFGSVSSACEGCRRPAIAVVARRQLNGEHSFLGRRWTALGRLSVYDWEDKLRPRSQRNVFWLRHRWRVSTEPGRRSDVEWEHDMNRLVGQRFRILALLNLTVTK